MNFNLKWELPSFWLFCITIILLHLPVGFIHRWMKFEHFPTVTFIFFFASTIIAVKEYAINYKGAIGISLVAGISSAAACAIVYGAPSFYVVPVSALLIGLECLIDFWLLAKMNAWFLQTGRNHLVFLVPKEHEIDSSPNPTHSR